MKSYEEIKNELLDTTMSMDRNEAINCLESTVRSAKLLFETFGNEEAFLEQSAAQEILDSIRRG